MNPSSGSIDAVHGTQLPQNAFEDSANPEQYSSSGKENLVLGKAKGILSELRQTPTVTKIALGALVALLIIVIIIAAAAGATAQKAQRNRLLRNRGNFSQRFGGNFTRQNRTSPQGLGNNTKSTGCPFAQTLCNNGRCVPIQFWCDKQDDCEDNTDEMSCGCRKHEFQCTNGDCLPKRMKCDGHPDCLCGCDEHSCPMQNNQTKSLTRLKRECSQTSR